MGLYLLWVLQGGGLAGALPRVEYLGTSLVPFTRHGMQEEILVAKIKHTLFECNGFRSPRNSLKWGVSWSRQSSVGQSSDILAVRAHTHLISAHNKMYWLTDCRNIKCLLLTWVNLIGAKNSLKGNCILSMHTVMQCHDSRCDKKKKRHTDDHQRKTEVTRTQKSL